MALMLIHIYRYLASPWLGNQCRFYPSCSHYAEEAIERFGVAKGAYLALRRLLRCHPWHEGGIDLVPESLGCKYGDNNFDNSGLASENASGAGGDVPGCHNAHRNPTINLPTIKK